MSYLRSIVVFSLLCVGLLVSAQMPDSGRMQEYAEKYINTQSKSARLQLANDFFAYLYQVGYIDDQVVFPANSHLDSVDVNVYFYLAEYNYSVGNYRSTVDFCKMAEQSFGEVDEISKSDVYAELGAAYFRLSEYSNASEALHHSYEIDKATGDLDRTSSSLNSIASAFIAAGKPQEAEKYILEAISANSQTNNHSRLAVLYGTASEMYRAMGDHSQALSYARKSLAVEREIGDSAKIGVRLAQLANAQMGASMIDEAQQSLGDAIPLLYNSGNLHSWAICQNQMGDILASEGKEKEAAEHYREAAALFLKQGDKYNEKHAREGLYKVTKSSSPDEAMMHLERSKQLQDSIYNSATGEAIGKYNAVYYNDILRSEKERAEREKYLILTFTLIASVLILLAIGVGIWYTYRRHNREKQHYHRNITSLQDKYEEANRLYRNVVSENMQVAVDLTDDDRAFLDHLTTVVGNLAEEGITDIPSIVSEMHINDVTLRRRLAQTLSETPQAYILRVRMNKAKYLLQNYRDITIAEVADKCGYSQVPNFTRAFSRYYGMTPSDARVQKPGAN